ncbi:MAG: CDP-diacylglycerol--glycerol-3-phosphate 3-phosphatidyltransferase [Planctomycetota bacterium]|nr:CDP-diacylglycerol--glycerol-3-phosphate 3-phosphatidyltransferase [Planctomycetota bacterium]
MSENSTGNDASGSPANSFDASSIFNIPNQLTCSRIVLAIVMFCFLEFEFYLTGMVLFIVAASTDWIDGYYARKYGMVTTLGRILDPFADKVIICGAFIYLVASPVMLETPWGLRAWMVVVIIGRELLVTAIRSFIEQQGSDFSAKQSGKWKMLLQCIAAGASLFYLSYANPLEDAPGWCVVIMISSIWAAVALTVYSGVGYVVAAAKLLKRA